MYNNEDIRCASKRVRSCAITVGAGLAPIIALYVLAIVKGSQGWMLAVLLAGFFWLLFMCDLCLLPRVRYLRFLKDMDRGLRRNTPCTPDFLEEEIRIQDGVRVRELHVRTPEGDSRILYVNASKAELLPPMGDEILLESYGRHVVGWKAKDA